LQPHGLQGVPGALEPLPGGVDAAFRRSDEILRIIDESP
jgi:hypothetical protein